MSTREKRQYYRVHYPSSLRPSVQVDKQTLPVIDISERGIRFARSEHLADRPGETVAATVHFRKGASVTVRGKIVRIGKHDIAMELEPGISFRIIVREQRVLIEMAPYVPV